MSEHIAKRTFYVLIWAVLMCLTALTAVVAKIDLGWANAPIALTIAATKATLVALFFMHMRWSNNENRVAAVAGILLMSIMIGLTCADFFTRYGMVYPNQ
jgi:cytochrome c oxidase subunit IV